MDGVAHDADKANSLLQWMVFTSRAWLGSSQSPFLLLWTESSSGLAIPCYSGGTWEHLLPIALSLRLSDRNDKTTGNVPFDILLYSHLFCPGGFFCFQCIWKFQVIYKMQSYTQWKKEPLKVSFGSASRGNSSAWSVNNGHQSNLTKGKLSVLRTSHKE